MSQLIANILVAASLNLLLALAFYPSYHTTRFFNLSHAFLPTCAAYMLLVAALTLKLPLLLGGVFGVLTVVAVAVLMERLLFAPLRRKGVAGWQLLVASLGSYTVLLNVLSVVFGDETRTVGLTPTRRELFGATISDVRMLTVAIAVLGFGFMSLLLQRTPMGRAIRAVGSNAALAEIVGVSPAGTAAWAITLGGLYAGMGGILAGLDTDMTPGMGFRLLINGVVTMIVAGVGNLGGLIAAALLLASSQHLVAYFFDSKWMDAVAFSILIGLLIWKPLGFSGRRLKKVEI
jgi:branched-chain amino acid transport system permease protein